jgi:hypothetical protein
MIASKSRVGFMSRLSIVAREERKSKAPKEKENTRTLPPVKYS